SGRSDLPAATPAKRVCVGSVASTVVASTVALPSRAASGHEAVRTVATTACPAGASTVTIALPAETGRLKGRSHSNADRAENWAKAGGAAKQGMKSVPNGGA